MKSKRKVGSKSIVCHELAFGRSVPALGGGVSDPIERKMMGNYQKVAVRDKVDNSKPSILGPTRPVLQ